MKRYLSALSFILVFFTACNTPCIESFDTEQYTEQAAMSIYMQEPDHALALLDTAVMVGNLSPEQAEYLRACIYFNGLNDAITAKHIATQLIENNHTAELDEALKENVYSQLALIAHCAGDDSGVLQYAPVACSLAEQNGEYGDVGRMTAYIAYAMASMGQTDEAVRTLQKVISDLESRRSWPCIVAYMPAVKSLLHLMYNNDRVCDMLSLAEQALQHINDFEQDTNLYTDLPEGFTPDEFIDMSRAQLYCFICIAEAELGNTVAAKAAEQQVYATNYGKTDRTDKMLVTAWLAMGDWQKFDRAFERMNLEAGDTINQNFLISLKTRSNAAEQRGRTAEALRFQKRALVVQDSLATRLIQEQIAEQATLHNLHEATLARERAESRSHTLAILLNILIIVVMIIIAFAVYFFLTRRSIKQKNKVLIRLIDEQQKAREKSNTIANNQSDNEELSEVNEETYKRLCALVIDSQLYADILLDREKVAEQLGVRRKTLNLLLNQYADGQSFPQWINDIRLSEACRLLRSHPDLSISDIATAVGLTSDNLRRLFRQRYGISPSEYRSNP